MPSTGRAKRGVGTSTLGGDTGVPLLLVEYDSIRTMSSHQRPAREPIKSTAAQRRAMTARRHEMAGVIRKARKSHAVALKRRVRATTTGGSGTSSAAATGCGTVTDEALRAEISSLADDYVKAAGSPAEASALSALQTALAKNEVAASSKAIESLINNASSSASTQAGDASASALMLADTLARSLSSQSASDEMRLDAARVLTNLAVCGSASNESSDLSAADAYYGAIQENWCDILIRSSAIGSLVGTFQSLVVASKEQEPYQHAISLCEQCCWALGNVAGDSQRSRDALRSGGVIGPIVAALRFGLNVAASASTVGYIGAAEPVVGLCRNAAWALSNLARGSYSSAVPFLQMDNAGIEFGLLTPGDLYQVLAVHELSRYENAAVASANADSTVSSWMDVANECNWLVCLITGKEDEAVEFLFSESTASNLFCASLATTLAKISNALCSSDSDVAELALRNAVPCVRVVGNIAASCEGKYVSNLLAGYNGIDPLATSVTRIIQVGTQRGRDYGIVAAEACWAAGTLLVDAGTTNHPSTASCEVLVPALCDILTSGSTKIELKREAASALCNAVAAPPPPSSSMEQVTSTRDDSQSTRDRILIRISNTKRIVQSLTSLLICFDADAVYSSLVLVDLILRRVACKTLSMQVKTLFEEANIVDALETICDRASATASYGNSGVWRGSGSTEEKCAELAADLIDDIFGEDDNIDDVTEVVVPQTGGPSFVFGASQAPEAFDFGLSAANNSGDSREPMGRGLGRGRGKVIPSWMQQEN